MPELILLALVSLTAMGLLVFLFLKMNQDKTAWMKLLMDSNQSLLNQARTKDLSTLAGVNQMTAITPDDSYIGTEERELAAYYEALSRAHIEETPEGYEEDMDILRGVM